MARYTVFDAATGEVLRSGICPAEDIARQSTAPSEIVVEGEYRDDQFKMVMTEKGISPRKKRRSKPDQGQELTSPR